MRSRLDELSWDDFRLVEAIAGAGTLPLAAERLGLNHSTVFRRLRQIEGIVGCSLFERERARLVATTAGEELAVLGARMGEAVSAAALRLADREPTPEGEVRLATNDSLLMRLLVPMLADFRRTCPRVRLDVVIGNETSNLARRDADVAVRATDAPPDTLVGRKVARIAWAFYGRRRADADGSAPADRPWVALGETMGSMQVVKHALANAGTEGIAFRANSVLALAEAVEMGLGVGHLPCFIGDASAGLERLADPDPAFATDLWLLTHADLRRTPRIRLLLDFLAGAIARRRDLIEGRSPMAMPGGA